MNNNGNCILHLKLVIEQLMRVITSEYFLRYCTMKRTNNFSSSPFNNSFTLFYKTVNNNTLTITIETTLLLVPDYRNTPNKNYFFTIENIVGVCFILYH